MKRFITAMLTLALITGLSSDKASAQISMTNTAEGGLNEVSGIIVRFAATETGIIAPNDCPSVVDSQNFIDTLNRVIDIHEPYDLPVDIFLTDCPEIVDPDDCPRIMDRVYNAPDDFTAWFQPTTVPTAVPYEDPAIGARPEYCPSIVDLWFELVDAGYTEDEAFEMIEMVMGEDGWIAGGGYKLSGWVYDEEKQEMYWVD